MSILRILPFGVLGLMFAFAFATYGGLPPEIPTRFGFDGTVNEVTSKSIQFWFGLPFIALGVHLLIFTLGQSLPRRPELFNFPDKARFLRLPRAYQGPVITAMQRLMDVMALLVTLVIAAAQAMMWRAADGHEGGALHIAVLVLSVAIAPVVLLGVQRLSTAIDAAERRLVDDERRGVVR